MIRWSFPVACLLSLSAHAGVPKSPEPASSPAVAAPVAEVRPSGVILANFDTAVRPQDDLYRYVNGGWLARTEIPADRSNYGSFIKLQDDVQANLKVIVEEAAAANAPRGSEQQAVGAFYASFMDEARAEQLGLAPLAPEFARIASI